MAVIAGRRRSLVATSIGRRSIPPTPIVSSSRPVPVSTKASMHAARGRQSTPWPGGTSIAFGSIRIIRACLSSTPTDREIHSPAVTMVARCGNRLVRDSRRLVPPMSSGAIRRRWGRCFTSVKSITGRVNSSFGESTMQRGRPWANPSRKCGVWLRHEFPGIAMRDGRHAIGRSLWLLEVR